MKIGLLITSIGNFGQKGFYNSQEIGLSKSLDTLCDEVKIYKLVLNKGATKTEKIEKCKNSSIKIIPSKNFGINGLLDISILDKSLDVLIYFSDTQLSVPKVYKWCKKNNVKFYPYIGVTESHSNNKIKKFIIDTLFKRNLNVYKKCHCFVKTPKVENDLKQLGVEKVTVTPVGLDLSIVKQNYQEFDKIELKQKYGYKDMDKIILFIGRLIDEKQPIKLINIFNNVSKKDDNYKLLIVGNGPLESDVKNAIEKHNLQDKVQIINKIPNSDIWQLYRLAECFVNLNQQEIFGMAILEAMYYGCKVVAWEAPGPSYIIKNGVDGVLCSTDDEIINGILNISIDSNTIHNKIVNQFTWQSTADKMFEQIKNI